MPLGVQRPNLWGSSTKVLEPYGLSKASRYFVIVVTLCWVIWILQKRIFHTFLVNLKVPASGDLRQKVNPRLL